MPTAHGTTSLQSVLAGLAGGSTVDRVVGSKHAGPIGIESIIEYRSKYPIYLNVVDWVDTFIVVTINGLDGADLRLGAQPNPGEHGETPNDALYGGRTLVLIGKQYAKTIWKLRDMQQGLRGAFAEIKREYPLIFHAADPSDDLMLMCKLADKPNIPDQQTTRNDFVRDFQITLRASNPRFLSVITDTAVTTAVEALLDFNAVAYTTLEDFTLKGGVSSGYTGEGNGFTPGTSLWLSRDYQRNMIANPRATVDLTNITNVRNETGTAAVLTREVPGSPGTGIPFETQISAVLAANSTYTGVMFKSASVVGNSPPVFGGEKLRLTGWLLQNNAGGAANSGIGYGVKINWRIASTVHVDDPAFVPVSDYGYVAKAVAIGAPAGEWIRINVLLDVPALQAAYPEVEIYASKPAGGALGTSITWKLADMMLDIDRGVAGVFGDADAPGWMSEAIKYQSPSRRILRRANLVFNPVAAAGGWVASVGATPGQLLGQAPAQPYTGHTSWWKFTTTNPAFSLPGSGAPLVHGMGLDSAYRVAEDETYNLSFYMRAATVPRRVWFGAFYNAPAGNAVAPRFYGNPTQDQGVDGKDAVGEWRRFWVNIPVPAGQNRMSIFIFVSNDAADATLPVGEVHEVSAVMLRLGADPRRYVDANGTIRGVPAPEYVFAGNANQSESLGPMADRNMLDDPDSATATTVLRTALNSVVTKVSSAADGANASPYFYRAAYTGLAPGQFAQMGLSAEANASERAPYSASMFVRLPPGASGARKVALEIDWFDRVGSAPNAVINWATTAPVDVATEWVEIKLEGITAPPKANSGVVYALILNPQPGDVLDVDRMLLTELPALDRWFGPRSEWAEPIDGAKPDGAALRYYYSAYRTQRQFTEVQQTVSLIPPSALSGDPEVHLTVSYVDAENKLYVACTSTGKLGIYKRDSGVPSTLVAEVAVPAKVPNLPGAPSQYWLRARLQGGVIIAGWYDAPPDLGNAPKTSTKYTLTASEVAKYQDVQHPIQMGIQQRGGRWAVNDWTYTDMTLPTGWKYYEGAGTITQEGGGLKPTDLTRKVMVRSGVAYKVSDASISIKHRYETQPPAGSPGKWHDTGIIIKALDKDNWLALYYGGNPVGGFGTGTGNLKKRSNGVESYLPMSLPGGPIPGQDQWVVVVTNGNDITIQSWQTDPLLGGAPLGTETYTLTGADAVKFGANIKGEFGIYWNPAVMDGKIDLFRLIIPKFDDIAMVKYNKGNFEAQTTIELTGPMTNPVVRNEANNTAAVIQGVIPTGETWVLENSGASKRFYRKSDGANRFQYLAETSMWVLLEPNNVPNNIRFTATALGAGWDVTLSHRHTYM